MKSKLLVILFSFITISIYSFDLKINIVDRDLELPLEGVRIREANSGVEVYSDFNGNLTIELKGAIPVEFRKAIGNRIYGCDDCQLICPWNRFATESTENDYQVRNGLDSERLLVLFAWSEADFMQNMQGSPIRRIKFERWQRNLAIALGNAPYHSDIILALESQLPNASEMVVEHINWAIRQHLEKID